MPDNDTFSRSVDKLGRSAWGIGSRLFGDKIVPPPDGELPPLDPSSEAALDAAGATLGRWMHAAGVALQAHPTQPAAALDTAREHLDDVPEAAEGETVLTAGARDLAGGLFTLTERVLDKVAPRKPT